MTVPPDLLATLTRFVAHERILIALDFDGTLAPEVDDPARARALPAAHEALLCLRELPGVTIALISGRALVSLASASELPGDVPLVGSHGLEVRFDARDAHPAIDAADRDRVRALQSRLEPLVASTSAAWLELKPAGVAVHTRLVDAPAASALHHAVTAAALELDEALTVREGKNVVEFSVRDATKGHGLRAVRARFDPDAVLFAGDDVTDEDGFAALEPHDVGIKVGAAATCAVYRVADPEAIAHVLRTLCALRQSLGIAQ